MQPVNAFFDLRIGGLSNIFLNPSVPVQFHIQIGNEPFMKCTLLDVSGKDVEPSLFQSSQQNSNGYFDLQVQWGYTAQNPLASPVYGMMAKCYHLTVGRNLYYIDLEAETLLLPMVSSNPYSGTALECLQKFAQNHNFILQFDPQPSAASMTDCGINDFDSTEPVERKHMKLANECDMSFFKHLLTFLADANGVVGYQSYFYTDQSGNSICRITNAATSGIAYTFDYPATDSTVLDWRPDVEMPVLLGSNYSQVNSNSVINGDSFKNVLQQQLTQQFSGNKLPPIYNPKPNPPPQPASKWQQFCSSNAIEEAVKNSAVRVWNGGTLSPLGSSNLHLSQQIAMINMSMNAELEVLGDPTILPGRLCQINHYYPQSREIHWTSGQYMIHDVLHSIIDGAYRTTLKLWKSNTTVPNQGEANAPGYTE
jgi:hypothetical protein